MKQLYRILILFIFLSITAFNNDDKPNKRSFRLPKNVNYGDYTPNTLIIKYKNAGAVESSILSSKTALQKQAVEITDYEPVLKHGRAENLSYKNQSGIDEIGINRIYQVKYTSKKNIESVINLLLQDENIEYAEPNYICHTFALPDDPAYPNSQYYLDTVKAPAAWAIQPNANREIIAIIDSGSEITHPDLAANIYINENDPINGIDDDGDGFIDNYYGWDFVGGTLGDGGDNDPNVKSAAGYHGIHVSGIASAVTNNGIGVASIAQNARLMILKAGADDTPRTISHGYHGIIYAAQRGVKIINCSWGGNNKSGFGQDAIDYAISRGCLVIAAAGNDGNEVPVYPAAYNGVLAVANTNDSDIKSPSSSYGYHVALAAPGTSIYNTWYNGTYGSTSGTSMAAPLVSSAAALIAAKYPHLTGVQIGEILRQNTDDIYSIAGNQSYINKLGTGRLNVEKALTNLASPAIKKQEMMISDNSGALRAGTTISLSFILKNLLYDATNLTVELGTLSPKATVNNSLHNLGNIASGATKALENIDVYLHPELSEEEEITFYLNYTSPEDNYEFREYFTLNVNRDYIDYLINDIATTITSNGRIGFSDSDAQKGSGFKFKGEQLLYEAALMVGTSGTQLSDNARTGDETNEHFVKKSAAVRETTEDNKFNAVSVFSDEGNPLPLRVAVTNRHIAYPDTDENQFVITEYEVKNISGEDLDNVHIGLFTDWDIDEADKNITRYNPENKLAYAYSHNSGKPYAGVRLLTDAKSHYYPMSNMVPGNILEDDNFTKEEKYITLSSGIFREELGSAYVTGLDIQFVTALGPFKILKEQSVKAAFAFVAGNDLDEIKQASQNAQVKYDELIAKNKEKLFVLMENYPNPVVRSISTKTTIDIKIPEEGNSSINLYNLFGQHIQKIFEGTLYPGSYTFNIDLKDLPVGVYYCSAVHKSKRRTIKILLED